MRITYLTLKNWRNFRSVDVDVQERLFIVGPNASGKSNLLDALRFLRDIARVGGGLQEAVTTRGGIPRVRSLAARNFNHGRVQVAISLGTSKEPEEWSYLLDFTAEQRGQHRPVVTQELVRHRGVTVLSRPDDEDRQDEERLTQTALEQVNANREFREVADFLESIRYLHLVPQVVREPDRAGDRTEDPYGGDFLLRVARTPDATRRRRLRRLNDALRLAVPQLDQLELVRDPGGKPHLQARYQHWRVQGARQDERDFSDGTLRLIGLLWSLLEGGKSAGPLLLEEPELSLHASVIRQLPTILSRMQRTGGPQVLLSTHAGEILADEGLGLDETLVLFPGPEGTTALLASEIRDVKEFIDTGMNLEEILRPLTEPQDVNDLPRATA
ncbi:MAG TPA: AAA family ATPase [Actinomycetes bacterium]|nr:AAA family ATPase [Actinomycetes bacterium]